MAKIIAVCSSKEKGVRKDNIHKGILKKNMGLKGMPMPTQPGTGKSACWRWKA
jgi:hypothetical protein